MEYRGLELKNIILDVPPLFKLAAMEQEAKVWDQAKTVLKKAKTEADRRHVPYDRLRFYIGCFDGKFGYVIKEARKSKNPKKDG